MSEISARTVARDHKSHLVRARQPSDQCFVLLDGLLIKEKVFDNGSRHIPGCYVPGDVCGLTSLFDGFLDHDLVALSATSCLPITRHQLFLLMQESPVLSWAVCRELSRECAISAAWIVNLGQRPAYQRLAYLMCELEARFRAGGTDTSAGVEWRGTQSDIGAATGLSLVHVNKTLRRLEADGLVISGRTMRFPNIDKLRVIAGFDPAYLAPERESLGDLLLSRIRDVDAEHGETAFELPGDPSAVPAMERLRMAS